MATKKRNIAIIFENEKFRALPAITAGELDRYLLAVTGNEAPTIDSHDAVVR
jgi:hypothetical protein